jgi:hypothetical protein
VAAAVALRVQARWARIVGIGVPLFLTVGGTIASIANDDNALRHPSHAWPFVTTVLQRDGGDDDRSCGSAAGPPPTR